MVGESSVIPDGMFSFGNEPLSYDSSSEHPSATDSPDYPHPPIFYPPASQYRTLSDEQHILTSPPAGIGYGYIEHLPTIASSPSMDEQNKICPLSAYVMPTIPSQTSGTSALNLQPPQNLIIVPTGLETPGGSGHRDQGLISSSVLAPNPFSYISPIWGYAPDYTRYLIKVDNDNATLSLGADRWSTNDRHMVDIDEYQQNHVITRVIRTGSYKCHYPDCNSRGGYKQKEHLVRHINTQGPSFYFLQWTFR